MSATRNALVATMLATLLGTGAAPLSAQPCSDGNDCTGEDMCVATDCVGTPLTGATCELDNEAFVNPRCVTSNSQTVCAGDPAPAGSSCARGCGTLQPLAPELPQILICAPNPNAADQPCPNLAPCQTGVCQEIRGGAEVQCAFALVECPDIDGDPCTTEYCVDDECVQGEKCGSDCDACNPTTGECEAAHLGLACDDGRPCTPDSHCIATEIPGLGTIGQCVTPAAVATATPTVAVATPTKTAATAATPTDTPAPPAATATEPIATATMVQCDGDCDHDGIVRVNELITGVSILLGRTPFSDCSALDSDGDEGVAVHELIRAVNSLLEACTAAT
jgi:hypothetical protein